MLLVKAGCLESTNVLNRILRAFNNTNIRMIHGLNRSKFLVSRCTAQTAMVVSEPIDLDKLDRTAVFWGSWKT